MATAVVTSDAPWPLVRLGDAVTVVNGGTPKSKVAEYWGGEHQWLTPADMGKMAGREIGATPRTLTSEGLAKSSARLVPPNSVILSTRAPIGHLAINETPMAFNQGCRGLVPSKDVDHLFLYYFLMANRNLLDDLGSGTTFKELSATNLKSVSMPLPSLEEQKRIVAVLDQAFAALDRARANAEANLADAEELYWSGLDVLVFENVEDWHLGSFKELVGEVSTGPFGSLLHKKDYVDNETPLVNPANIVDGKIEANHSKTVAKDALERLQSYKLKCGDIVIGRRGEMGRCAAVSAEQDGWLCGTGSFFVRPEGNVSSELVAHILRTRKLVAKLTAIASGTTMLNLSNKALGDMEFAIPPIEEQARVLSAINRLKEASSGAVDCYRVRIGDLDDLRQSILQKAFDGKLT